MPVHVNTHEAQWVSRVTGIPMSDLTAHHHGDKVNVGDIGSNCCTPGHTPGSQCFLLDGRLVAVTPVPGRLRARFPGGDADEMFRSLQQLAALSGNPTVFPVTGTPPAQRRSGGGQGHQLRLPGLEPAAVARPDGRLKPPLSVPTPPGPQQPEADEHERVR